MEDEYSINRLIENGCAKAMKVVSTGDINALREAIDMLGGAHLLLQMEAVGSDVGNGGSTPTQYGIPVGTIELQDLIEHRGMNFAIGNIFKACYRLGMKAKPLYDINKILWFAEREKNRLTETDK